MYWIKKGGFMKKNLLIVLCLFLSLNSTAFAEDAKSQTSEAEIKHKTRPAFSFINLDFSSNTTQAVNTNTKSAEREITNKNNTPQQGSIRDEIMAPLRPTDKDADDIIHFFRLDLLGIFKIQL